MVFDCPVFIDTEDMLVDAGQAISEKDIERLIKWGIGEVETKGNLVKDQTHLAGIAGSEQADSTLQKKLEAVTAEYESMRRQKPQFRILVRDVGEILQSNINGLIENGQFQNHNIVNASSQLVHEILSKKLLLLAFCGMYVKISQPIVHAIHAACYGASLAMTLDYNRPRLQDLVFSMLMMDAGMSRIPVHIREINSRLSDSERTVVKAHPVHGYQLLVKVAKVRPPLATVALQHHENFDGSGYPQGLKGGQIDETARIAAIADRYTAMIEDRPYRNAMPRYKAMKQMLSAEMGRYDPQLLRKFLGSFSIYPVGSIVALSDTRTALVVASEPGKPLRPLVRLLRDEDRLPFKGLEFVDLLHETDLHIVSAVDPVEAGIDLENEI